MQAESGGDWQALMRAPALPLFSGAWVTGMAAEADSGRFLAAFFRFVTSEYVEHRAILPPKAAGRRRAEVRVIRLRKEFKRRPPAGADGAGEGRTIPVRGHWRMQWYASQGRHAPIWVHGFWKGDDSMPVVGTDRIFSVDR